MKIEEQVLERSLGRCELCGAEAPLQIYTVEPEAIPSADSRIAICTVCKSQLTGETSIDASHWTCLKNSMWSDIPAVQVITWRMLSRLSSESWASDALDMLYLDDEKLKWARAGGDIAINEEEEVHRDCNGALLKNADSVVLTKSLDVKGSQINARIGTVVKNIRLVADNTDQIEGKIEGQQIVILTKYVRKVQSS